MPVYQYKAKKKNAETVTGSITAHNHDEAVDLINQLGFLPVVVEEQVLDGATTGKLSTKTISSKELYIFSRQMANLLRSGISLLRALVILQEQSDHKYFKRILGEIVDSVKHGASFSDALKKYPKIFSTLYVTMIRAGEESGALQEMLVSVASYQRAQEEIYSKVRTALAYPILMAVVGFLTVYFILTFVLPKMSGLFDSIGNNLPTPTVILLQVSEALSQGWVWVLGCFFIVFVLIRSWKSTKAGRLVISQVSLKLPLIGPLLLHSELARFCRTLVLLQKGGSNITNSLKVSIPVLGNEVIKSELFSCQESLLAGGSFGEQIKESKHIPTMMGHLISVGEESGNLNEVLNEIAENYEQETNEKIKIMTTLIEPLMILIVGLAVGFIVFAMLLPIFQMDILSR